MGERMEDCVREYVYLDDIEDLFEGGKLYDGDDVISALTQIALGYEVGKIPSVL